MDALEKYLAGKTVGQKNSIPAECLNSDFVNFIRNYKVSVDMSGVNVGIHLPMYKDIQENLFVNYYAAGIVNRGPSAAVIHFFRNIDLGRNEDMTVDWGSITNQFELRMYFLGSDCTKIILENCNIEIRDNRMIFTDGVESVSWNLETNNGIEGYRCVYSIKNKMMYSMFLVKYNL